MKCNRSNLDVYCLITGWPELLKSEKLYSLTDPGTNAEIETFAPKISYKCDALEAIWHMLRNRPQLVANKKPGRTCAMEI